MYYKKNITCKVTVEPKFFNSKIKKFLLSKIRYELENKCTKDGYIKKVHKIINKSLGKIYSCDLSGDVVYDVTVEVTICCPEIGQELECMITSLESRVGAIICKNDPLLIMILNHNSSADIGDTINIIIKQIRFKQNDKFINIIGEFPST